MNIRNHKMRKLKITMVAEAQDTQVHQTSIILALVLHLVVISRNINLRYCHQSPTYPNLNLTFQCSLMYRILPQTLIKLPLHIRFLHLQTPILCPVTNPIHRHPSLVQVHQFKMPNLKPSKRIPPITRRFPMPKSVHKMQSVNLTSAMSIMHSRISERHWPFSNHMNSERLCMCF